MATQEVITTTELAKRLLSCSEEEFTGQLDLNIKEPKSQRWSLYFYQGGLIWGASEVHPMRRLLRQLSQHCPQLTLDRSALATLYAKQTFPLAFSNSHTERGGVASQQRTSSLGQGAVTLRDREYHALGELVRQGKVTRSQMAAIVESHLIEVLFDIYQGWDRFRYHSQLYLTYRSTPQNALASIDSRSVSTGVDRIWSQAMQAWQAWQKEALAEISPNLAPAIAKAEELRWQTSPKVYQNLMALVDGTQTFRELAVKLRQNPLPVTQSIVPYIRKGLIEAIEVQDFTDALEPATSTTPQPAPIGSPINPVQPQPTSPLVACIDDSRMDCQMMSQILTQAGYRCILIQDPVTALPLLLEHKPDLIFLDLVMPVTNGYEVCGNIRRISVFKDTPVIILTGNDGIVDRVRAKLVGSSSFLAKPIEREKVLLILQKYLAATMPSQS